MSRLDDLIDLIQTTNEVYFITAPGRVRTAYILVDDIVELALKTFLQERALAQREQLSVQLDASGLVTNRNHRNALDEYFDHDMTLAELSNRLSLGAIGVTTLQTHLNTLPLPIMVQHWSANDPEGFRTHPEVIRDVRACFVVGHPVHPVLDEAVARHQVRNKFYHDHRQTGLTIDDDKCLRALCGMFDLMEQLFPGTPTTDSFRYLIQRNKTTRCQVGVLRLKLAAHGSSELEEPYNLALRQFNREHRVTIDSKNYEHSVLHTISDDFFIAIRSHLYSKVTLLQKKLVDENARLTRSHSVNLQTQQRSKIAVTENQLTILSRQLGEIDAMMSTP